MLVRYRLTSVPTVSQFKADLHGIITGTITSAAQLSSPAQASSVFLGTYPADTYASANATTYTYSKTHNEHDKTHYFRLVFDSEKLLAIGLAQSYDSGTDTLVNGITTTFNVYPKKYNPTYPQGIDIVINDKMFVIASPFSSVSGGVMDIGHSGVTRDRADSMLMAMVDFNGAMNNNQATLAQTPMFYTTTGANIPYTYNYSTSTYGMQVSGLTAIIPVRKGQDNNLVVPENPLFVVPPSNGYTSNLLYGAYKVPTAIFSGLRTYTDANTAYRLAISDFSLMVD